ncbi:MAG: hypothetical protein Q9211_003796 [Gyalolechia sp. 1 TL-2023]
MDNNIPPQAQSKQPLKMPGQGLPDQSASFSPSSKSIRKDTQRAASGSSQAGSAPYSAGPFWPTATPQAAERCKYYEPHIFAPRPDVGQGQKSTGIFQPYPSQHIFGPPSKTPSGNEATKATQPPLKPEGEQGRSITPNFSPISADDSKKSEPGAQAPRVPQKRTSTLEMSKAAVTASTAWSPANDSVMSPDAGDLLEQIQRLAAIAHNIPAKAKPALVTIIDAKIESLLRLHTPPNPSHEVVLEDLEWLSAVKDKLKGRNVNAKMIDSAIEKKVSILLGAYQLDRRCETATLKELCALYTAAAFILLFFLWVYQGNTDGMEDQGSKRSPY